MGDILVALCRLHTQPLSIQNSVTSVSEHQDELLAYPNIRFCILASLMLPEVTWNIMPFCPLDTRIELIPRSSKVVFPHHLHATMSSAAWPPQLKYSEVATSPFRPPLMHHHREWVAKCLGQMTDANRAEAQAELRQVISDAFSAQTLWTTDWQAVQLQRCCRIGFTLPTR